MPIDKEVLDDRLSKFLSEIDDICMKYNISISHEDFQGGFIFESYKEENIKWLKDGRVHFD